MFSRKRCSASFLFCCVHIDRKFSMTNEKTEMNRRPGPLLTSVWPVVVFVVLDTGPERIVTRKVENY